MEGDNELDAYDAGGRVRFRVCFFEAVNGGGTPPRDGVPPETIPAHAGRREEQLWQSIWNPACWVILFRSTRP